MAERIVKIILPQDHAEDVKIILRSEKDAHFWQEECDRGQSVISVLAESGLTEQITDKLEARFATVEGFHMVILAVQASLPHKDVEETKLKPEKRKRVIPLRISREELFSNIHDSCRFSRIFMLMTALSTIVAAIGLLRSNVAAIIGAMVIAPLLGPNVGLALATTLADFKLARESFKTLAGGVLIALTMAYVMGLLVGVDPSIPEIASRTELGITDVILALAAGCAGVLAFTTGASSVVIGVMVAVALLPPLTACGFLAGAQYFALSRSAFLLFLCNIICINLAGVVTFLLQGIRPRTWWEADKAKRSTRVALILWGVILSLLVLVIHLSR